MDDKQQAYLVVNAMMAEDAFSRWLGIEIVEMDLGYCKLSMTVRPEMVNGFGIAHGGIAYSLADSALAFASNSYGRVAVAISNSISYQNKVSVGDELIATAREIKNGKSLGFYSVDIICDGVSVADFRGTVYRTSDRHEV